MKRCTRLWVTAMPSSAPSARSNFSPAITVRSWLVATKVSSRKTFIAPARSGKSVPLTTLAVRKAVAWRFGTVRYSGVAPRRAVMIGTFWAVPSLGTLDGLATRNEALVAPASIVAAAYSASRSAATSPVASVVISCMFTWRGADAAGAAMTLARARCSSLRRASSTGSNTSRFQAVSTGAAPPREGRAVESVRATSFQSSPVVCRTTPK